MKVYTIKDNQTGEHSAPFYQAHDVAATRSFTEAVRNPDPNNMLNKYPKDFTLMYLGEWDPMEGMLNTGIPRPMLTGDSALRNYTVRHTEENTDG